ncbi:hypothetical protein ANAPRD1_01332 [Anaplasma phagocytophilum]|nr:hypothetical protein ANAPRD1_01332 [Anaplasma phagocytophilum]
MMLLLDRLISLPLLLPRLLVKTLFSLPMLLLEFLTLTLIRRFVRLRAVGAVINMVSMLLRRTTIRLVETVR